MSNPFVRWIVVSFVGWFVSPFVSRCKNLAATFFVSMRCNGISFVSPFVGLLVGSFVVSFVCRCCNQFDYKKT